MAEPTHWYWVRHGPTHEKTFVGWRDVPADLSDRAALDRLSAFLPAGAPVVSSDLIRASATADAIQGRRPRLPDAPEIREINLGLWDGQPFDTIARDHPDTSRTFWETPGDIAAPEGESWNDLSARVSTFVNQTTAKNPGRAIVAVAHIGVIITQVQKALGVSAYEAISHKIDNLSVTHLIHDGRWQAKMINHSP